MGGGGGETTNITNTGLGDDQYTTLTGNQANLGTSIDTLNTSATTGFNDVNTNIGGLQKDVNTVGRNVSGVQDSIGVKGATYDFSGFPDATPGDALTAREMAEGVTATDLRYDVNGDGFVTQADAEGILRSAVGLGDIQQTGLYAEFADQTQAMTDQFGNVIAGQGDLNKTIGNQAIQTQNNIGGQLDTLGNTVGGRFDTVDTATGNIQGAVDKGFVDQNQGFVDAQADRTTNAGVNAKGFSDAGDALTKGFGDASTQLTETQTNVLGGQDTLQGNLDTMSDDATTYANAALENQAALKTGQEGFQSSFDTYAERYGEDTTLANQTRADMQLANANASAKIREEQVALANASATQLGSVAQGVDNQFNALEGTVEGGFMASDANTQAGFAGVQADASQNQAKTNNAATDLQAALAGGIETLDAGQITAARDMANVAASQTDLDIGMRQNFKQIGSAFDDTGALISSSIDEQGNTINRKMDDQGNMILDRFSVTGEALGQKVININNTLTELGARPNNPGANVSMGNLTPASSSQVPTSGFASPFATTSG